MPRKKKTRSGEDAQAVKSVPGQRYGEGVQQAAMQEAMPAPNVQANSVPQPQAGAAPASQPAPAPMPRQPVDPMRALQQMPTNLLGSGDARPDTAGMPFGAGRMPMPGELSPSAPKPSTQVLQSLYKITGDPKYAEMINRYSR